MTQARILIIHHEPSIMALLGSMLQSLGHQIDEAGTERAAVRRLERGGLDLLIVGIDPSDPEALELLAYSRRKHPQVPVILLFPAGAPDRSREAIRMGATAILKFPMPATELRAAVTQACDQIPSSNGNHVASRGQTNGHSPFSALPDHPSSAESRSVLLPPDEPLSPPPTKPLPSLEAVVAGSGVTLLGDDPAFRQAVELAATVAPARAAVLIVGEQGTGKTLIARAIHGQSNRRDQPFLEVSCGGIDDLGLERELFGQQFDGDDSSERPGRLARAQGGTLLLDEVGSLSPAIQSLLLQVMIDGEFSPVGSNRLIPIDVRFLFATRENLPALVEQGKFRRELYERINAVCLKLPPLRKRGADIIGLAEHFRERFARDYGKPVVGFTPESLELLTRHDWPGNVRELESVIQRGVALSQGPRIQPVNLAFGVVPNRATRPTAFTPRSHMHPGLRPLKEALEEPEKQIIIQALRALNWNRQETARVLDINRTTLYKKMKKYGLLLEEPALLN